MIGYKVMPLDGGRLRSGADSRLTFPLERGTVLRMRGDGIFLAPTRKYVLDYYSGLADEEVLLTLEVDPDKLITGNLSDREPELSVREATIVDYEKLEPEENPGLVDAVYPRPRKNPRPNTAKQVAQKIKTAVAEDRHRDALLILDEYVGIDSGLDEEADARKIARRLYLLEKHGVWGMVGDKMVLVKDRPKTNPSVSGFDPDEARSLSEAMFVIDKRLSVAEAQHNHNVASALNAWARLAERKPEYFAGILGDERGEHVRDRIAMALPALEREDPDVAQRLRALEKTIYPRPRKNPSPTNAGLVSRLKF